MDCVNKNNITIRRHKVLPILLTAVMIAAITKTLCVRSDSIFN